MKKQLLSITAIVLTAGALVLTGCSKDDTKSPVVTIKGADQTISLQARYTELGADATDDKDGTLTPAVSGAVNTDKTGIYVITYTATDAAGNSGTATRNVTVVNDADKMTGNYTCTIAGVTPYTYDQTVTASTTLNNRILFGKFGNYINNTKIYADVVGSTITLPSQKAIQVGSPAADRDFSGTGIINGKDFGLDYTETTNGTAINTKEAFVKK
ncbi:MAG: immunoglobulin-like domain-containing protein [Bacteroidia bacterium]